LVDPITFCWKAGNPSSQWCVPFYITRLSSRRCCNVTTSDNFTKTLP